MMTEFKRNKDVHTCVDYGGVIRLHMRSPEDYCRWALLDRATGKVLCAEQDSAEVIARYLNEDQLEHIAEMCAEREGGYRD